MFLSALLIGRSGRARGSGPEEERDWSQVMFDLESVRKYTGVWSPESDVLGSIPQSVTYSLCGSG